MQINNSQGRRSQHAGSKTTSQLQEEEEGINGTYHHQSEAGKSSTIRSLGELTVEEQEKLTTDVTRLFLFTDAKKQLVKREDIRRMLTNYKFPKFVKELIARVKVNLIDMFGFELISLPKYDVKGNAIPDTEQGTYLLRMSPAVKKFLSPVGDQVFYPNAERFGLLMVILGYLFINGCTDKETFWKDLKRLDVEEQHSHASFGDCQSVVNTFVAQDYLNLKRVQSKNGTDTVYVYFIGPRSYAEITKKNILTFVAKMCGYQEPDPILLAETEKEDAQMQ